MLAKLHYAVPFSVLLEKLGFATATESPLPVSVTFEQVVEAAKLIAMSIEVDEEWYLKEYEDVATGIAKGTCRSAKHHFIEHGYIEGRHPFAPQVDENWYLAAYPDVAEGTEAGEITSANDHYRRHGYSEGRLPAAF